MQELTMQAFVTELREKRGWSMRRLAEELGYASATSLVRLCQEKANAESIVKFSAALGALREAPLDDEETMRLASLVERAQAGDENYRANQLLIALLKDKPLFPAARVTIEDAVSGQHTSLTQRYQGRKGLKMMILNCERVPLFEELAQMERTASFPIDHFFVEDGPASWTVERILAIMPILYDANYKVYSRDLEDDSPMGMLLSDLIVCGWEEDGQPCFDLITFLNRESGHYMHYPISVDTVIPMFTGLKTSSLFHPVRLMGMDEQASFADYCLYCMDLEHNRTVMRIKPDFGVEQIPVSILARAAAEGPGDQALVQQLLPGLIDMFERREENARKKRQPQYHVLTRWGVWRFVRTGRLSDQPWILRTFTVQERQEVLRYVMDQLARNPGFHLRFSLDERVRREDEITYYEGKGLCLVKPHTDYQLGDGHAEILVSQKRFMEAYRSFFLESLMRYHVTSHAQTIALLGEMLRYLNDHCEEP